MYNSPPDPHKINQKIVAQQKVKTIGTSPPAARSRWKKSLGKIGVGLSISTLLVSIYEYPGYGIWGSSIERQQWPALTATRFSDKEPTSPHVQMADLALLQAPNEQADRDSTGDRVTIKTNLQEAQAAVRLAKIDVEQAQINLETFKNNYNRYHQLVKRGGAGVEKYRQKLAEAQVAADFAIEQKSYALHGLKHAQAQLTVAENSAAKISQLARTAPVNNSSSIPSSRQRRCD
jgi:multidrug resistance efflux pump